MELQVGSTRLTLVQGDITVQQVDAIVNAANAALRGGRWCGWGHSPRRRPRHHG